MSLFYRVVPPRVPSARPPLLVLLHGIGADEEDLLALAPHLDPRFLVVSVRAPDEEPPGYRWYQIDWSVLPPRADPLEVAASRDALGYFLEELVAAQGADPERVYLFGFSQGAIMSVAVLLARPELVRGVVAHSGRLVRLPGVEPGAEALAHAELLVLHGSEDPVVPVEQGRKIHQVLSALMGERASLREYPGLGHGVSAESVSEAARWLTARLDGPTTPRAVTSGG
jgi:phospholipase/carboxylesterase